MEVICGWLSLSAARGGMTGVASGFNSSEALGLSGSVTGSL